MRECEKCVLGGPGPCGPFALVQLDKAYAEYTEATVLGLEAYPQIYASVWLCSLCPCPPAPAKGPARATTAHADRDRNVVRCVGANGCNANVTLRRGDVLDQRGRAR